MTIEQAMNPTIEEAIQRLEGMVFTSDLSPSTLRAIAVNKLALAALRECAEREKGCEFCTPKPNERVTLIFSRIGHTSWGDYETAGRVDGTALHCPKCGRKLERGDT